MTHLTSVAPPPTSLRLSAPPHVPPLPPSTSKQGWFISSFERQGQWVAGGGYVPLSHAICCRPCLPGELPPDPSGRIPGGAKPLAIISLGCHSSTDVLSTRCELEAGSFVSGYSEAVKVFTTVGQWRIASHGVGWCHGRVVSWLGGRAAGLLGVVQPVWPPRCRLRTSAAPACHARSHIPFDCLPSPSCSLIGGQDGASGWPAGRICGGVWVGCRETCSRCSISLHLPAPPFHPPSCCSYYPVNTVSCCSPALLLENGDAWELERCGCHDRQAAGGGAAAVAALLPPTWSVHAAAACRTQLSRPACVDCCSSSTNC